MLVLNRNYYKLLLIDRFYLCVFDYYAILHVLLSDQNSFSRRKVELGPFASVSLTPMPGFWLVESDDVILKRVGRGGTLTSYLSSEIKPLLSSRTCAFLQEKSDLKGPSQKEMRMLSVVPLTKILGRD